MNKSILKAISLAGVALMLILSGCIKHEKTWSPNTKGNGNSAGSGSGGGKIETVADYSGLTAANHPRVILTGDSEASIKLKVASGTDENVTTLHNIIIKMADGYLGKADLVYKLSGKRLLDVSRAAANRIVTCAYAYRMTGEKKYLEKAEKDILTVCAFKNWNASQHFLDTGEMAFGVGIGYDWLYNDLKESTKSAAVEAIRSFAFDYALNKNPWFYTSVSNWNQVCNGGLVVAALSIYEKCSSESKKIIDKAISTNAPVMKEIYNPDGNYPEGYGYWGYGTAYECLMLSAMETCTGSDNGLASCEGFAKTGKWVMFMEGMNRLAFNYCDCAPSSTTMPALWYLADKFKDPSMLYVEGIKLSEGMYNNDGSPMYLPMAVTYADKVSTASISAPTDHIWSGHGINPVGLVRGDWTFSESDKFLGLKTGKCNNSHGHMDVGSFVYDALGVRWSADYGLQSYSTIENYNYDTSKYPGGAFGSYAQTAFRWGVFRYNNYNHSTITLNDALHLVTGTADIDEVIDKSGRKGFRTDLSAIVSDQCEKAERTICIVDDRDLEVTDVITAKYNLQAKLRWTLVSKAQPTLENNRIVLKASGKTMYLTVKTANGTKVELKEWPSTGEAWDAQNTGYYELGFVAKVTSGTTETFTVKLSPVE